MDFDLDKVIYRFNGVEDFTIGNACEGVQIFGGIGSGKTSGSGEALARAFLRSGFGGLVLCAKKDVLDEWKRYARETGRANNLLVFDASGDFVFPFLQPYKLSVEFLRLLVVCIGSNEEYYRPTKSAASSIHSEK